MNAATSTGRLESAALIAIDLAEGELRDAYRRVYVRVVGDFAPWSFENIRQLAGKSAKKLPEWVQRLVGIMQQIAGNRITLVTGTLKERVRSVLQGKIMQEALTEGFGIDKIVRLLKPELEQAYTADYLIERVARTEIISSSNFATQAGAERAAEEFDIELEKVWISTNNERTRRQPRDEYDHLVINEQRREMADPFDVPGPSGDVQLMYPGDPSGPPGAVINCRCALAHEPKDL